MSTAVELVREALTAKLAVDLDRPHRATVAAEAVARLAAQLVEELADVRAQERQADDDNADHLAELLAERYPASVLPEGTDDEPAGPT